MSIIERQHIPALDGVRAFAILGVLGIHADADLFPGGHLGVSVFFVLSGYLISTVLIAEIRTGGSIGFPEFYLKRAVRLFPALGLMLLVTAPLSLAFNDPQTVGLGVGAALLYVTNIVAATFGIAHLANYEFTWTLSLEEQFYLVWPLILSMMARWKLLVPIIAICAVVLSEILRAAGSSSAGLPAEFFAPQTRMSGLFLGALIAWFLATRTIHWRPAVAQTVSILCVACIAISFLVGSTHAFETYVFWIPSVELASALLIMCLVQYPAVVLARVLSLKPVVYLGTISYGVYLWNVPINEMAHQVAPRLPYTLTSALAVGICVLVAGLSYKLVEAPIRRWARPRIASWLSAARPSREAG